MRIAVFCILAVFAMLISSCATQPSPPTAVPRHEYLPQQFEMHYLPSAFFGGRTEIVYVDGYLVRRKYVAKERGNGYQNVLEKTEYFVPSKEQWRDFWMEMARLRILEWRERYDPSDVGAEVYEGGGWHVLLAYRGKAIDTSGENAGPKQHYPSATAIREDGWNRQLDRAILQLIGES